jgi:hypothetical protein
MENAMQLPIALAACFVLTAMALPASARDAEQPAISNIPAHQEFSAAKRKKAVRGYRAYGSGGTQIACTQLGCNPAPRGCRVVPGRIPFTWDPSGFDEIQCPYYR